MASYAIDVMGRPYAGAPDLERTIDLLLTCRAAELLDPWPPAHAIRMKLADPAADLRDAHLWESPGHELEALGLIWDGSTLIWCIRPEARGDDLETAILHWALERAEQIALRCGERTALCIPVRDDDPATAAGLARRGFRAEDWRMLHYVRPLDMPIPEARVPAGYRLRPLAGETEAAAHVALQREAFVSAQVTVEDQLALMRSPAYRRDLDLVIEAPGGELAAFCLCSISWEENAHGGRQEAWVDLIGTRPARRHLGLGRALLLGALRRLRDYGMQTAMLNTGSWNMPAHGLFESCGFSVAYRLCWFMGDEETAEDLWAGALVRTA